MSEQDVSVMNERLWSDFVGIQKFSIGQLLRHGHFENEEGKASVFKKAVSLSSFFYAVSQLDSGKLKQYCSVHESAPWLLSSSKNER